ncbi:MAG: hypothetical protein HQL14_04600 [Candidatus Omnitrophica bacterium]|nr:hypothetical protein [Candidatus Omnitrophota bacterium]
MKKHLIIFILSFGLGGMLISTMASARSATLTTYYPSQKGAYTKVILMNAAGGPNENGAARYCAANPANNAGTIFVDPTSKYMEVCKSDGAVASYPGACFQRFCVGANCPPPTGANPNSCPRNYAVVLLTGTAPFPGTMAYDCCFTNLNPPTGAMYSQWTQSGCFSLYSTNTDTPFTSPAAAPPPACTTVDPNAYDMGCSTVLVCRTMVRTCCFNAKGAGLPLGAVSACPAYGSVASTFVAAPIIANNTNDTSAATSAALCPSCPSCVPVSSVILKDYSGGGCIDIPGNTAAPTGETCEVLYNGVCPPAAC